MLEPCRRAVDDEVEVLGRDLVEMDRLDAELLGQFLGPLVRAVGHRDPARAGVEQRSDDAAHGAARAQHQHRAVAQVELEPLPYIAHEADAVGVVADDRVTVEHRAC